MKNLKDLGVKQNSRFNLIKTPINIPEPTILKPQEPEDPYHIHCNKIVDKIQGDCIWDREERGVAYGLVSLFELKQKR